MTKADIVNEISEKTGIEKIVVQTTVEAFMKSIRTSMTEGKNVYLRGFGTFVVKKRAEKVGRNISKNTIELSIYTLLVHNLCNPLQFQLFYPL